MSHTIWGSFDGALTQYIRPYIEVSWTQNVANNTSTVTANLYFHRYTNNYWSYNELTNSNGHSSTFRVGNSTLTQIRPFNLQNENPPNRVLVWSRTQTITHNANGSGSVNISASGNTNVNPQHYSFGETVTLPQIPRQTTINSVSIGGALSPSTSQTVSLSVDRKHSSYVMDYQIYAGGTRIRNLTNQGVLTSISLSDTHVNNIINTMSSVTSRNLELRVTTKDSSGNQIGVPESKTFNVSLNDANTRPSFTHVRTEIAGTGHDHDIGVFVQSISRLYASFVVDAGYGASIRSRNISVDGQTFGSQYSSGAPERYHGNSSVLTRTGNRTVTFSATNSRNQTHSITRTISVSAYSTPRIVNFRGARNGSTPTTVALTRRVEWSALSGDNSLTLVVSRKQSSGTSWTNVSTQTNASGLVTSNVASSGNAETIAYDFRIVVTDQFGNTATSTITVPSAKVLMHYLRDDSIGIGRYSQNEAELEVGGSIRADSRLMVGTASNEDSFVMGQFSAGSSYLYSQSGGHLLIDSKIKGGGNIYLAGNDVLINTDETPYNSPIIESGSNSNGNYVKYYDGTMICWDTEISAADSSTPSAGIYRSNQITVDFPQEFVGRPAVHCGTDAALSWSTTPVINNSHFRYQTLNTIAISSAFNIHYTAIGRWR